MRIDLHFKYRHTNEKKQGLNTTKQGDNVLAYKLSLGNEYIIVIHNFEKVNVELDVSSFASEILDEVSVSKLTPELESGKLRLGKYSTVVLR